MILRDKRGRRVFIYGVPLARASEAKRENRGRPIGYAMDIESMNMRTIQTHICEGAPCAGCEIACGYGRRYLELMKERDR